VSGFTEVPGDGEVQLAGSYNLPVQGQGEHVQVNIYSDISR